MNELEKHSKTFEQRKAVEEFLDWLNEQKIQLGSYGHCEDSEVERMAPILLNRQELLDQYFGINAGELDKERKELLEREKSSGEQ